MQKLQTINAETLLYEPLEKVIAYNTVAMAEPNTVITIHIGTIDGA